MPAQFTKPMINPVKKRATKNVNMAVNELDSSNGSEDDNDFVGDLPSETMSVNSSQRQSSLGKPNKR